MTDKERIGELGNCEKCRYARKVEDKEDKISWYECTIEDRTKFHEEDYDGTKVKVIDCPLKTFKLEQNAKAVEALERVKEFGNKKANENGYVDMVWIDRKLDQLIKGLKGE